MSHNVVAINKFWAGILGTVFCSAIGATVLVEKSIYDGLAQEVSDRKLLAEQVKPLLDGNLPTRMATMEANITATTQATQRIELQAGRTDEKIDRLLERQYQKVK